jgi:hypothetical protein
VQGAPDAVARYADWPVNEVDLHARHRWLVYGEGEFRERMKHDPDFYDAKRAGWWVWGLCQWIGSGWCASPEWWKAAHEGNELGKGRRPHLKGQGINGKPPVEWTGRSNAGRRARGVLTAEHAQRPDLTAARGVLGAEGLYNGPTVETSAAAAMRAFGDRPRKRARDLTGSARPAILSIVGSRTGEGHESCQLPTQYRVLSWLVICSVDAQPCSASVRLHLTSCRAQCCAMRRLHQTPPTMTMPSRARSWSALAMTLRSLPCCPARSCVVLPISRAACAYARSSSTHSCGCSGTGSMLHLMRFTCAA